MDAFITQWRINCNHQHWKITFASNLCHHFACDWAERLLHISASRWAWIQYSAKFSVSSQVYWQFVSHALWFSGNPTRKNLMENLMSE
jgi:hypothetical protein